ncbi:MAG: Re/Si-specific NAD(P)(+) transhydrogenase subunit alpha [Acidobacteriota bacterium]
MRIAVPKESRGDETRVALAPESCKKLVAAGIDVVVEAGAGTLSYFPDSAFQEAGAAIAPDAGAALAEADLVAKIHAPIALPDGRHEVDLLRPGSMLLGSLFPTRSLDAVRRLASRNVTAFSTDCIPRITRAQTMDTLSSQANIVGYKGILLGALELPKYFPMFMTAAGTTLAAKVFVIGAGVAGLQAIATAKRLGAIVTATDVRPEVKEQIESVGAKYVGIELKQDAAAGGGYAKELSAEDKARQAALLAEQCGMVDLVVTTALIGGVMAPKVIDDAILARMKPGSVLVDLGADGGGNCVRSRPGEIVEHGGVKIVALTNLPARMPHHASLLFSRNLHTFIAAFWNKDAKTFNLDWTDEILKGCVVTHEGKVVHGPTEKALAAAS